MLKKKILIVDDDRALLMMLDKCLSAAGYSTAMATNGKDAVFIAKEWNPNLIILDIMMPDMDGTEAAHALRGNETTKKIPKIFLTSLVSKEEEKNGKFFRGNIYIAKPYEKEELLKEINKYI